MPSGQGKRPGGQAAQGSTTGTDRSAKSRTLTERVNDAVYNYHSTNDNVLKRLYSVAMAGQKAAGLTGFTPTSPKLKNVDVSDQVKRHSGYFANTAME